MEVENHKIDVDGQLFFQLKKGDEAAFARLFYTYYDKLYGFLLGITHSPAKAEDITQDVFAKIWQTRKELPEVKNVNALLFRMAQNLAIDELRRQSREQSALSAHFEIESRHYAPQPLDLLLREELNSKIAEAVDHLPLQQKKTYKLYKENGIKQDEIARKLNLSLSTIQSHMKLAMGNIHKYLSVKYPDLLGLLAFISILEKF